MRWGGGKGRRPESESHPEWKPLFESKARPSRISSTSNACVRSLNCIECGGMQFTDRGPRSRRTYVLCCRTITFPFLILFLPVRVRPAPTPPLQRNCDPGESRVSASPSRMTTKTTAS